MTKTRVYEVARETSLQRASSLSARTGADTASSKIIDSRVLIAITDWCWQR